MKKIIVFIFLFVAVTVSAQNNAAEDTTAKPAITAIGKPDGRISEKMMDKDGGTLVSSDGTLELIIPSGALSKKTSISIQPVTNLMPNGNGMAYQLEPSGIQFKKPVQIVFHYDPEESQDSAQLLMAITMQDDKGQWYGLNEFNLDTVAKTISGNINHFSVWATFDKLKLLSTRRLKVTKFTYLRIRGVTTFIPEVGKDGLSPLKSWIPPKQGVWKVNGFIKGNPEVGTLAEGKKDESTAHDNVYQAPANLPAQNPVTIRVDLVGASYVLNGIKSPPLYLTTKILIYDNAYEVTLNSTYNADAGTQLGSVTYWDDGIFIVSLNGKDSKIIYKENNNVLSDLEYAIGNCTVEKKEEGHGNIHIVGAQSINVIPSKSPSEPATVIIKFIPAKVILPILSYSCPNRKGGPTKGTTAMASVMAAGMIPAFPIEIRFKAIEGYQELQGFGKPGETLYFKCTVKQLKDD